MNSNSRKITIRKRDGEIHCDEFTVRSNLIIDGVIKTRESEVLTVPNSVETTGTVSVGGVVEGDMGASASMATFTGLIGAGSDNIDSNLNIFTRVYLYCINETTGLRAGLPLESTIAAAQFLAFDN